MTSRATEKEVGGGVCESRVGSNGGRGPGRGEEALGQCHCPML